jgi:RpiB/LacA/LacB family sugar-phosphate isomerase
MKKIKDKQLLVGADFAGFPLKEAIVVHLKKKGWEITDVGVRSPQDNDTELMFHRVGLRVGAMISEGEFERALIFCGTGMGIHIAASKCPHVHAGVVESVPAGLRAITGNGVNVLAMGAFYVAPQMGIELSKPI